MEGEFLQWLDKVLPAHLGTIITICLGGFGLLTALFTGVVKIKNEYEEGISNMILKEENDKKFKSDIKDMINQVKLLKENTEFLSTQYAATQQELTNKVDDIANIVRQTQESTTARDEAIEKRIQAYEDKLDGFKNDINTSKEQLDLLIDSDKESIRSFIVDKYYQVMDTGYINSHLLQVLEERYTQYHREGGNGYITTLMEEMRELPHSPKK